MNIANQLTVGRILLALATFIALLHGGPDGHALALLLFIAAMVTDWIDGWIARTTHTISPFGKIADPIADKILVLGSLLALTRAHLGIPLWAIFLIIARELLMGGLRALAGAQGKVIGAERWGKWSMAVQSAAVLAIIALLNARERLSQIPPAAHKLPYFLTLVCAAVAWLSAYLYYRLSRRMLEKSWG
ncbi:MAG: CDP-diacylglycerol--glycerol-3-phosphate 3-phosphatidyltransferase [Elusimicrobia bacterium]|nr:CDP-diacylglycerol--glycerol-3-phosphate 3-phosphatidyltransferase [Elusimicrobiota bacterium]